MNLNLHTVIENILWDTGVWDIKLIRIRLSEKKKIKEKVQIFSLIRITIWDVLLDKLKPYIKN